MQWPEQQQQQQTNNNNKMAIWSNERYGWWGLTWLAVKNRCIRPLCLFTIRSNCKFIWIELTSTHYRFGYERFDYHSGKSHTYILIESDVSLVFLYLKLIFNKNLVICDDDKNKILKNRWHYKLCSFPMLFAENVLAKSNLDDN